jgi:diguanylate cyclase (GGDEF)-like protein
MINSHSDTTPRSRRDARASAERRSLSADQQSADADQHAADREQVISDQLRAASDADQLSSAQDDQDSETDQATSDADQGRLDRRPQKSSGNEVSRRARVATTQSRLRTRDARAERSRSRGDAATVSVSSLPDAVDDVLSDADEGRARAASDRRRSAGDRTRATLVIEGLEADLAAAQVDPLTGALGRERGELALKEEVERARRGDGRFILAFIDLDDLKGLNDRDGHAAGDEALRELVSAIRANLRSFDPIVRYGGDEFVCGVGGVGIGEVERRLEMIRIALKRDRHVGFSVGLASLQGTESLDEIVSRADANLLAAKRARRR